MCSVASGSRSARSNELRRATIKCVVTVCDQDRMADARQVRFALCMDGVSWGSERAYCNRFVAIVLPFLEPLHEPSRRRLAAVGSREEPQLWDP